MASNFRGAVINILVAVNGTQLSQQVSDASMGAGTIDTPMSLDACDESNVYIAMLAQSNYVANDQGKIALVVKAKPGDILRWTMTTFDRNSGYTAFIYRCIFNPVNSMIHPRYMNQVANEYLPSGPDSTEEPTNYHSHMYIAQAAVLKHSREVLCEMAFQLVNNSTGHVVGYFSWRPFIQISQ